MKSQKKELIYEMGLFITGLFLSVLMFKTLTIHTDNTQLMDKVVKLVLTGEWTHHGNAATKMGSLPGSFLTVITALPMMLWFNPYAACAVILLFHVISYFLMRKIGEKLFAADFSPLIFITLFWLNPWRVEQSELYNPGYLFLFSAIHIYTAYLMHQKKSFWATFYHVLCIGFCFQVHFSVLIIGLSSLYLFLRKKITVNWWGFLIGAAIVIASLIPWLLEKLSGGNESLQAQSGAFLGRNLVLVYPVIKSIIYFFRMGSMYFGRHIFSEIRFDWITTEYIRLSIDFVFHVLKWILAAGSLYFSFKWLGQYLRNIVQIKNEEKSFPQIYFLSLFLGLIGAAALSPVEFNHWHLILVYPAIALYMSVFFKTYTKSKKYILPSLAIIFIVWNLLAALGSRSHSFKNDYSQDFKKLYEIEKK